MRSNAVNRTDREGTYRPHVSSRVYGLGLMVIILNVLLPRECLATDSAQFISETIPDNTQMTPGQSFTKTWTLRNSGTTTWTTGVNGYTLNFQSGSQMGAPNYVTLSSAVAPNGQTTFSVNMTAPTTPGTYTGYWRMSSASSTLFGPTISVKIVVTGTDAATFVSETIPDNTPMTPGQSFTKTWTLRNSGTTTWTTGVNGYTLNFQSGSQMGAPNYVTLSSAVAPNGQTTFSVNMTAPTTPGTYTGYWRMSSASSTLFGPTISVKIVVTGTDAATFVSETIPDNTPMTPGQSFTKTWTLRNSGTTTWTTGVNGYTLNFQSGSQMGAPNYVTLSSAVAPNGQTTFSVNMTAPTTPGTYAGYWRMSSASSTLFGPTISVKIVVTGTDAATFVSETIPDNTPMTPGQSFTKTWTLRNSGTTTWTTGVNGYTLNFQSGSQMGAPNYVTLSSAVAPNGQTTFSVNMTAPTTPGTYAGYWRMSSASSTLFGPTISVKIVVTGTDAATFVSETIPDNTPMTPGQSFTKTWTLRNSGTTTWTTGVNGYTLNFQSGSQMGAPNYVTLSSAVAPNGQTTFSVNMTAPTTPGTYTGYWRMSSASSTLFGPTISVKIVVTGTDAATFVSETIPDNTPMTPGQSFTKTWTLRNSGTTTWTTGVNGYTLNFQSGSQMGAPNYVTLSSAVAPNGQTTFSVNMTAPTTPGTYTGYWRMSSASSTLFGPTISVKIVVTNDGGSGTVPIRQDFIPVGRSNRPGYPMTANYITIHDTDNSAVGANAVMHASYLKNPDESAGMPNDPSNPKSWHFTVDDHEAYQHLPLNENGWHAGDGLNGTGNRQSIGIEICMNSDGNRAQAEANAAWLAAKLLKDSGLSLDRVKQHYDWSGKNCPSVLRGRAGGWDGFLTRVAYYLSHQESSAPRITGQNVNATSCTLSVSSQTGYNYVLEYKTTLADAAWIPLRTNAGNNATLDLTDTTARDPARFYRVRRVRVE